MVNQRVAIVAYSAPPYSAGGVASAQYNLMLALRRHGFEANLFTFGDEHAADGEMIVRRGAPTWLRKLLTWVNKLVFSLIQPGKRAYQTLDILASYAGARRMARAIDAFNPQTVILSDHGAPGLAIAKKADRNLILMSHHNPERFLKPPAPPDYSTLDGHLALRLEQKVVDKVDAVVCPSHYMRAWFERSYQFSGRVELLPNLIEKEALADIPAKDLRAELGLDAASPLLYLPSAGSYLKGADYALQIIWRLADLAKQPIGFYVPGYLEPRYAAQFKALSRKIPLHIPGQIPYKEHLAIVRACSFGISPSLMENFSMALLEALWLGVPMLAFDTGGNPDIIVSGQNGELVKLGDADQLVLHAAVLLDPKKLSKLRKNTLTFTRKKFDPEKITQAYAQLINSL